MSSYFSIFNEGFFQFFQGMKEGQIFKASKFSLPLDMISYKC